ncbi:MAG: terpene cyclase/mutase family protein [Planctomycetes bacterium]|nr:terpene cyclase/mutase family protein [Planctomycetota bacterium]
MSTYLQNLTTRLASGLARTPDEFRRRHCDFLLAAQNPDGGFSGREGGSDLYYTGFALRGLACLGALANPTTRRAADFLRTRLQQSASVVDFMSLLYAARLIQASGGPDVLSEHSSDWPARVAAALESFRKPDGGYSKATEGTAGSTYHTFLVALCYELIGLPLPDPSGVVKFVRSRYRDDGGYVEVAPARRGGTNPTAAAVALLRMFGAIDNSTADGTIAFLACLQSADGGLRANTRAPLCDLLSTFTGLLTLQDLGATEYIDLVALGRFIESIELRLGGFRGGLWDNAGDVEYTFYGLGAVALVAPRQ